MTGLAPAIAEFSTRYGAVLAEPDLARERCAEVSEEFVALLAEHGVAAQVVSGIRYGEMPEFPGVRLMLAGHYAVLVPAPAATQEEWLTAGADADLVYDWTARQFDPQAPVPQVQPLGEWRRAWSPLQEEVDS